MERSYRWGILGAGNIAGKFASALNYTERAEVYAVASREADKAKQFADKYGAAHSYGNYQELAEDPDVDIIYIATPHSFHEDQAILCLRNRKPVLCEKPMALNSKQVNSMVDAAHANKTFLMEGMWSRFMPAINKMLELIEAGVIGPVRYVRADFGFPAPYNLEGRLYNIKLGGGSLLDVGIYPLFLTTLLLGAPSTIRSLAKLAVTGADEYCNMLFQYPEGEIANIFSSITIKTSLTAEIAGTKGRIYLQPPFYKTNTLTLELNEGDSQNFSFPHEHNGFEYEIRQATACLDKGLLESPLIPHSFSLQMARVMDTVMEQCGIVYSV
jgi:predicted dehydrogenase